MRIAHPNVGEADAYQFSSMDSVQHTQTQNEKAQISIIIIKINARHLQPDKSTQCSVTMAQERPHIDNS